MSEPVKEPTGDGLPTADGDLVRAVLRGDRGAFDLLVGRYQRRATGLAYRLLGNVDDALEVTQEAFLRAYRKLGSLDRPGHFASWLMRIVANQALNFRRGRAVRKSAHLEDLINEESGRGELNQPDRSAVQPGEVISAGELQERIAAELHSLPEKQRQALVLFSIEKLPQKEVARMLEISVEAVKWHVFTARKKLREALKDYL